MWAAMKGETEAVVELVKAGANVDMQTEVRTCTCTYTQCTCTSTCMYMYIIWLSKLCMMFDTGYLVATPIFTVYSRYVLCL